MSSKIPQIKPIDEIHYKLKQSKYSVVGKLPQRAILLAPSGSGKTVLLQNMILDIYRDCFEMIYIFSPSIMVDDSWKPVKDYIKKRNENKDHIEEKIYFDDYNSTELETIIKNQHDLIQIQKSEKHKELYQILIIIDDMADNPTFTRSSKLLHSLYTRGRHIGITTITSVQKFSALHPTIRVNATSYYCFRLRNYQDLELFLTELGALVKNKKIIYEVYKKATDEPYSFLFVNLMAQSINNMFFINFSKKILIN
jgi:hypothetical protein